MRALPLNADTLERRHKGTGGAPLLVLFETRILNRQRRRLVADGTLQIQDFLTVGPRG
jgi:hypothetical protein